MNVWMSMCYCKLFVFEPSGFLISSIFTDSSLSHFSIRYLTDGGGDVVKWVFGWEDANQNRFHQQPSEGTATPPTLAVVNTIMK